MATGRRLSRQFFGDPTLSMLTFGHRLIYAGVFTCADSYGRYSADPDVWHADILSRDPYCDEEIIKAIQYDLALAGFLGFYGQGADACCVIYKFHKHQLLHSAHVAPSVLPTPPHELWHLILHPLDTGRNWDIDDMPYETYKQVVASDKKRVAVWPPDGERSAIRFTASVNEPFGSVIYRTVKRTQAPAAEVKPMKEVIPEPDPEPLPEVLPEPKPIIKREEPKPIVKHEEPSQLFSEEASKLTDATERERATLQALHSIKDWHAKDYVTELTTLRSISIQYPSADLLEQARKFVVYKVDKPLLKNSRPWSQFMNWIKISVDGFGGKSKPSGQAGEARQGGKVQL